MASEVFSFCTKNEADEQLVRELKERSERTGISFSRLIVDIIRNAKEVKHETS